MKNVRVGPDERRGGSTSNCTIGCTMGGYAGGGYGIYYGDAGWQYSFTTGLWTRILDLTDMWNCSAPTQDRCGFGLFEYTSNAGGTFGSWFEDYRHARLMFAAPVGMP